MLSNKEFAEVVGKNLTDIMYEKRVTQAQLAHDLGLAQTTVSSWMNGKRAPRMDKIEKLCQYLRVDRSELIDPPWDKSGKSGKITRDAEAAGIALFIQDSPELRELYRVAINSSPESIRLVTETLKQINAIK